ncbi:hypothetical protein KUCAC02_015300, partial [Chaenocephalus aceratus]
GRWSCVVSLRLQRAAAAQFPDLLHLLFLSWTVGSAAGLAAFDPAEQDFHHDPDSFTCSHLFPKTQPYSNNSLSVVAEIPTGAEMSLPLSLLAVNIWFPAMIRGGASPSPCSSSSPSSPSSSSWSGLGSGF